MTKSVLARVSVVVHFLMVLALAGLAQAQVAIQFDGSGLGSLKFNGSELLSSGALRVNRITVQDGSGGTSAASLDGSVAVDAAAGEIKNTYSWGTVVGRYQVHGNRLDIALTVTNHGSQAIQGVFLEPLELRLPGKPAEYDNVTPIMVYDPGEPGILSLTTPTTTVVLGYEDPGKPIVAGFPWANDRPASTVFPLRINTDREPGYPDSYPTVIRPIAPGASDQYRFSLRFGGPGATAETLAADVRAGFAAKFPATLHWTDKRPIGQLVLATSVAGYPTNPRGWLLDPTIDTTTPAGRAAFRNRILAWADQSVSILTQLNAQGMITWDIEGEEYPHSTTYLCDPRVLAKAAPEMDAIADEYFRRFTDAGLRVGVCVRPQSLVFTGQGASQQPSSDPAQVMIDKISYAKARWGATLFYVDSNGDPNLPLDADIIQRVTAAHPDVLVIPEHENTRYYAYTAPYRELRQNQVSTPDRVRLVYPEGFGITYVADGDVGRYFDGLVSAVQRGDSLLTRAWFADPANPQVQHIYGLAPAAPAPPSVSMAAPLDGAAVSGTIALSASATAAGGIAFAQFQIDGHDYGAILSSPPFNGTLDTTTLADGPHRIGIRIRDENGNDASAEVIVMVKNAAADAQPPTIAIAAPLPDAVVAGTIQLSATATDNVGVTSLQFFVDGASAGPNLSAAPFSLAWNSASVADGAHTVTAVARDAAGNSAMAARTIVSANTTSTAACDAIPTNTFLGCYYNRLDFAELFTTRLDPSIDFNWAAAAPVPGMRSETYTIRWQGRFAFAGGDYQFAINLDDGARLYIDGERVWDLWGERPMQAHQTTLRVAPGTHVIRLDYVQFSGNAAVSMKWSQMGGGTP